MARALPAGDGVREGRGARGLAGRRLAAYFLDWVVGLVVGWLLVLVAAGILLAASDLDRHDPSNGAVYAALIVLAAWLPLWFLYTAFAWSRFGATAGMAALGIGVVDRAGVRPAPLQAGLRALLLTVFSLPLLASPVLLALVAALRASGPVSIWLPVLLLLLLSAVACFSAFVTTEARAWHDRASGTRVIRTGIRIRK